MRLTSGLVHAREASRRNAIDFDVGLGPVANKGLFLPLDLSDFLPVSQRFPCSLAYYEVISYFRHSCLGPYLRLPPLPPMVLTTYAAAARAKQLLQAQPEPRAKVLGEPPRTWVLQKLS